MLHIVNAAADLYNHEILGGIYLLKVNDWNIWRMCKIYSKLTVKTPEIRNNIPGW